MEAPVIGIIRGKVGIPEEPIQRAAPTPKNPETNPGTLDDTIVINTGDEEPKNPENTLTAP